jgi:hypothetical protein
VCNYSFTLADSGRCGLESIVCNYNFTVADSGGRLN